MISSNGWQAAPLKVNKVLLAQHSRIAVVGIGNCLYSDDGVGSQVARQLNARVPSRSNWLVLDGGTAPENYTGVIRRFEPDLVLFVDAADLGDEPGKIAWLDWRKTSGIGASTHAFPIYLLASYVELELGCGVMLIGIQPENISFGLTNTVPVQRAVEKLVDELAALLLSKKEMIVCQRS